MEKDYKAIGYSTSEINIQKHRFYSLPFLLSTMTIIATIIMIYNKFKEKILFNLFVGNVCGGQGISFISLFFFISHYYGNESENNKGHTIGIKRPI